MTSVLIIGGGAIGLSLAYELACRGRKVTVVERGDVGRESSWAGAGIIPAPATKIVDAPPLVRLSTLAAQLHADWHAKLLKETGIDNGYRVCGAIYLADSEGEQSSLRMELAAWQRHGIEHEELTAERLATVEPALASRSTADGPSAVYRLLSEAQLRNPRHLRALESACTARGVRIIVRAPVEDFVVEAGRCREVRTPVGPFSADVVCLCGGAWSGELGARLGLKLNIKPIRGQIVLLHPSQPLVRSVVYAGPNFRHYFVARDDGRVLVGSTEEDVGFDKQPTAGAARELLDFAIRLAPELASAPVEQTWAGLRPYSADGLPYLGRAPELSNVFIAAGHYRWGLSLSTATAVLMSQLICDEPPALDLMPLRIDRAS